MQLRANAETLGHFEVSKRPNATSGPSNSSNAAVESSRSMKKRSNTRYWSGEVTRTSNALDLQHRVFTKSNPRSIALSLRRSALASHRRKASPYQSAMSMLNFYINRAGSGLSGKQKRVLSRAKNELRKIFHRDSAQRLGRFRRGR